MQLKINKVERISFYLFVICTLFSSCKTKEQKANKFVADFNKIMEHNSVISSKAYYVSGSEVTISAGFNFVENQIESNITEDTAPEIFIKIINSIPSGRDIYKDGVTFNLKLYDKNRVKFAETTLSKQTEEKITELSSIITFINDKMPYVDKETGISLIKLELDKNNNLTYLYEYPDDVLKILEVAGAEKLVKQNMANNPALKEIILSKNSITLNSIICVILDKNKKEVKRVIITQNEMLAQVKSNKVVNENEIILQGLINELNKRLPITDKDFGFKYLNCKLQNKTIVNTYLVPNQYAEVLGLLEKQGKGTIKKGLLGISLIESLVNSKEFKIDKITSIYRNKDGKILKEYTLTKEEFNKIKN